MSLEGRQKIISSIRESMLEHAEELAMHAHRETGLGRFEHKVIKNRLLTRKTSGTEVLTPHAVTGDNGLTLTEYAPYGVIGAITPTTNPTSTIICNTIAMLSAGNSIVFNVHPNARECSMANVRLLHRAIIRGGGPANLACAKHLAGLLEKHGADGGEPGLDETFLVLLRGDLPDLLDADSIVLGIGVTAQVEFFHQLFA